jgi:hypothetical protein
MKAAPTTLLCDFRRSVRFAFLGFSILECGLILDHPDMPLGRSWAYLPLRLLGEMFELTLGSSAPKRATG